MEEPVFGRVLLGECLTRVGAAGRWWGAAGRVDAVDFLDVADGICFRDRRLGRGEVGRGANGGELEPWHGFAAILSVIRELGGSGRVDLLGEADAIVPVDRGAAEREVGV